MPKSNCAYKIIVVIKVRLLTFMIKIIVFQGECGYSSGSQSPTKPRNNFFKIHFEYIVKTTTYQLILWNVYIS